MPACPNLRSPSVHSPLDTHPGAPGSRGLEGFDLQVSWPSAAVFQSHLEDAAPHAEDVTHKKEDGD